MEEITGENMKYHHIEMSLLSRELISCLHRIIVPLSEKLRESPLQLTCCAVVLSLSIGEDGVHVSETSAVTDPYLSETFVTSYTT